MGGDSGSRPTGQAPSGLGASRIDPGRKLTAISEREAGFIEGYAMACEDIMGCLTGERFSAKSYDPATVELERAVIHSYAFNLKDGGRHHPLSDYESVDEICRLMAGETLDFIRQEHSA